MERFPSTVTHFGLPGTICRHCCLKQANRSLLNCSLKLSSKQQSLSCQWQRNGLLLFVYLCIAKAPTETVVKVDQILRTASPPTAQIQSMSSAFEPHLGVFVDAQDKYVFRLILPSHCCTQYLLELLPTCLLRTVVPRLVDHLIRLQSLPPPRQLPELLSPPLTNPSLHRLYSHRQRNSSISTHRVWISVPSCQLAKLSLICTRYRRSG